MVAATRQILLRRWHLNSSAKVCHMRRRIFRIPVTFGGGNQVRGFQITVTIATGICMFLIVLLPQTEPLIGYSKASFLLNAMSKKSSLTLILLNSSIHSPGLFPLVFQVCFVAFLIFFFLVSDIDTVVGATKVVICFS